MSYGPGVLDQLNRQYTLLHDTLNDRYGVNVWYGEAGDDNEVAIMLLNGVPFKEVKQYLIDNYAEADYEEGDE